MEFEAGFLENTDMLTAFFGQDDYLAFSHESQKIHENVLVEKFVDYGVNAGLKIDSDFEGPDSLFDSEWMTSKIDLTSCLDEQIDSSDSTIVNAHNDFQSTSTIRSLLTCKSTDVKKSDGIDESPSNLDASSCEECPPISPEQHVPDLDGSGDQFQLLLDSYLAAMKGSIIEENSVKILTENDDVTLDDGSIFETSAVIKLATKRKMVEDTVPGPKVKVKTPEQKQRKRLQNRTAATRYRSKKKSEQETLNAQCNELEDENTKLREKVESKQQEIQYLKNLIIDVFNKKSQPARM